MKKVKAVQPYIHPGHLNFKLAPYGAWVECGGEVAKACYPWRWLHGLAFRWELPSLKWLWRVGCKLCGKEPEARLMFVEPVSITFDTCPYYATHQVVPFIWDCWPRYWERMERWMRKHNVRTAFFTSSQTAEHFKEVFPNRNFFFMPEGIDSEIYKEGKDLKDRGVDYFEFGRVCNYVDTGLLGEDVKVLSSKSDKAKLSTRESLVDALADSKITICLPRSVNQPEIAEGIETLTQRYWECMLSRVVMLGKAPQELIDMIGYDPCVVLEKERFAEQVEDILLHIEDYQELVDRNRTVAVEMSDWKDRMKEVRRKLENLGYKTS